jgi:hypothetical protein
MIKKGILFLLLISGICSISNAQEHDLLHDMVKSDLWKKIAKIEYDVIDDYEYYPIFTPELKNLAGKEVSLRGYMVPLEEGVVHSTFLISVLPINQCYFCGKNGIPMMVEVYMKKAVRYTDGIISITGKMSLNKTNMAFSYPIAINNAVLD